MTEGDAKHPMMFRAGILWISSTSNLRMEFLLLLPPEPVAGRSGLFKAHILDAKLYGYAIFP